MVRAKLDPFLSPDFCRLIHNFWLVWPRSNNNILYHCFLYFHHHCAPQPRAEDRISYLPFSIRQPFHDSLCSSRSRLTSIISDRSNANVSRAPLVTGRYSSRTLFNNLPYEIVIYSPSNKRWQASPASFRLKIVVALWIRWVLFNEVDTPISWCSLLVACCAQRNHRQLSLTSSWQLSH